MKCLLGLAAVFGIIAFPVEVAACSMSGTPLEARQEIREDSSLRRLEGNFFVEGEIEWPASYGDPAIINGRIESKSGRSYPVQLEYLELLVPCGLQPTPPKNASGTFWITRKKRDGRYKMQLWVGEYLPEATPIIIGEQYNFEALGEPRELNVILPNGYSDEPEKQWPVVYMLDGGMQQDLMLVTGLERWNRLWGRSEQAIIVGIETKDRQRELLPPTSDPAEQKQYPTAGESEAFRDWIASSVKPLIEQTYRANGTDILVGESAAGHFVVETWINAAELFDGYAAISPSMQWSNQSLARQITGPFEGKPPIYLSIADEGGATEEGILDLADAMEETQNVCFSDRRGDLVHANSLHGLLPEVLQYLLPTEADWLSEYGLKLRCERLGQSAAP